jgi:hypothetical protein
MNLRLYSTKLSAAQEEASIFRSRRSKKGIRFHHTIRPNVHILQRTFPQTANGGPKNSAVDSRNRTKIVSAGREIGNRNRMTQFKYRRLNKYSLGCQPSSLRSRCFKIVAPGQDVPGHALNPVLSSTSRTKAICLGFCLLADVIQTHHTGCGSTGIMATLS